MTEELAVYDAQEETGLTPITDDTLIALAEQAEKRIDAMNIIKKVAIKLTNRHDWTDQGGKPYLQVSGAEKIARMFGISWRISEPVEEKSDGGHFAFTYRGNFSLAGASIDAIGTRSSKDGFFKKYGYSNGSKTELPASEIDRGDVKKAAYTNCIGNGITRLLGLRNMTYEDLLEFSGIRKDDIASVGYKKEGKKPGESQPSKISDAQRKRFYAIAKETGFSDEEIKKHLLGMGIEHTADILKIQYDDLCKWAAATPDEPGEREAGEEG